MATKGNVFERYIQIKYLRPLRLKEVIQILNKLPSGKILDLGCMDDYILKRLPSRFTYLGLDDEPLCEHPQILTKRIESFSGKEKFDIVMATEVCEHVDNPIDLIAKMKNLSKRFILISVPNEPFFSFFRMFIPAREHLWTIFPSALKRQLGKPILEKTACFKRSYIALWDLKKK